MGFLMKLIGWAAAALTMFVAFALIALSLKPEADRCLASDDVLNCSLVMTK